MKLNKRGFTLVELMVVMAIIAVLAVLAIGAITIARRTASETENRSAAKAIQVGIEGYYTTWKAYPTVGTVAATPTTSSFTTGGTGAVVAPPAATGLGMNSQGLAAGCGAAASAREGGGRFASANTAAAKPTGSPAAWPATINYVIIPANYDCSADLGWGDAIGFAG